MAKFYRVVVVCGVCGHANVPHPSPSQAVKEVLSGHFESCRRCGEIFEAFLVISPPRKVIAEAITQDIPSGVEVIIDERLPVKRSRGGIEFDPEYIEDFYRRTLGRYGSWAVLA